ncbi:hypothetical protein KAJ89_01455 [Candidatus Parcubacteria bacterium]|nr:hypothetical protein [Candidatus Parcubacteria bacterium]
MKEETSQQNLPRQELNPERELPKPSLMEKIVEFFRRHATKKNIIAVIVILAVIAVAIGLRMTIFKPAPKQIYQVAIMVRDQVNKDKAEDLRTSLKRGDALVVQNENHKFSKTESVSYLILKMKLNEEQAAKLTMADEKELTKKEIKAEIEKMREERSQRATEFNQEISEEELEREEEEIRQRRISIRPRLYFIDLNQKKFEGFEANDLLEGQPFTEKVYNWRIVDKK